MEAIISHNSNPFNYSYVRDIVGYLAYFIFGETTKLAMAHFSKIDLTTKEGLVLELVANNPTASQVEIARKAGMKASLLVKILDDLSKRDLLIRRTSPTDRRQHHLHLTEAGENLRDQIQAAHMAGNDELFDAADFSAEERATLFKLLQKLTAHIEKI
ncbi:MAG: MarR family winged helix-turn-helix transcriptional regulator [Anaerolineae bacterium]